jgi:two-component system sensor histidine kinase TctE
MRPVMSKGTRSLRRAVLVRLLVPVALVALLAAAIAYVGARHFSVAVLDQWLYDAARSMANRVRWDGAQARLELRPRTPNSVDTDVVDRYLYEITTDHGVRVAGNASLPSPPEPLGAHATRNVYFGVVDETPVRVLELRVRHADNGIVVKVGESVQKRTMLARQLLWLALGVSVLIGVAAGAVIWYGIGQGIAATGAALRKARLAGGRTPLAALQLTPDTPVEVVPLVAQINALIEQLAAAHRLNERFIINAAHQLRTPVATLRVQLEAASRSQDGRRRLEHITDAVQMLTHMSRVLHQLLTLAQADESASRPASDARVDIAQLARDEVAHRIDDAVALGVDLGYDGPSLPVVVPGHPGLVREALANLLDNALRYGAAGGIVTVGVIAKPVATLYVEDRGPGIPEDERPRVLDRFYRMPGTSGNGCGLGLAIVDEIARSSGATLELASGADGAGLRAILRFSAAGGQRDAPHQNVTALAPTV